MEPKCFKHLKLKKNNRKNFVSLIVDSTSALVIVVVVMIGVCFVVGCIVAVVAHVIAVMFRFYDYYDLPQLQLRKQTARPALVDVATYAHRSICVYVVCCCLW